MNLLHGPWSSYLQLWSNYLRILLLSVYLYRSVSTDHRRLTVDWRIIGCRTAELPNCRPLSREALCRIRLTIVLTAAYCNDGRREWLCQTCIGGFHVALAREGRCVG